MQSWAATSKPPASLSQAGIIEGSDASSSSEAENERFASSLPATSSYSGANHEQQHQHQRLQHQDYGSAEFRPQMYGHYAAHRQQQQQQQAHGPLTGWLQSTCGQLSSRYYGALDKLQARGLRHLDGLQASAQQIVPWPQMHIQRRSALRLQVHSLSFQWPQSTSQHLELNLTDL